ncbi:MAG: NAD(P)-binding domain-containing protein [Gammaproteobacteria bacterium]|nr:NAD(P)-binding domain-containing protein [Gammaproteobacteria bacterium]
MGVTDDNSAAVAEAELVVMAVKPQIMRQVLEPLQPALAARRPVLMSIAAGITVPMLARWGGDLPLVRCMPNTPALVGAGMARPVRQRCGRPGRPRAGDAGDGGRGLKWSGSRTRR